MESNLTPFRALGQRSIASIFLSSSSNPFKVSKGGSQDEGSEKGSRLSLSDFLHRKLHQTSEPPRMVKGKSRPFSSLLGPRELSECKDVKIGAKEGEEADTNSYIDKVVFEQFKHTGTEKVECVGSSTIGEAESCNIADVQESRKRKNVEGDNDKYITRKHFTILGGDSKSKQRRREKILNGTEKLPLYDHYANGRGWWESGMEGIDDEEVGLTEAWEGVGSTTTGGVIDWH